MQQNICNDYLSLYIALGCVSNTLVFTLLNCIFRCCLLMVIAVLPGYPDRADTNSHRHLRYG
jgi:hypothetical protein